MTGLIKAEKAAGIENGPGGLFSPYPKIIAFDPGGTTGYASYHNGVNGQMVFDGGQLGPHEHHVELYNLLQDYQPHIVVCEAFEFRQHKGTGEGKKDKVELMSCEYIGVIKMWCRMMGMAPIMQGTFVLGNMTNTRLDKLGLLYKTTLTRNRHYHDAMRHLLYYLVHTLRKKEIARSWLRGAANNGN